jgi:NAD(P)-dependent dehydrogenase (short-subunit alcohol dehydrogenase family)
VTTDVSVEDDIVRLVDTTVDRHGPIDLFCSNAGVGAGGGPEAPDDEWQRTWDVNLMAHVWAARRLVPEMLARGEGYFLQTASAAGLLAQIGSAPYSVTKHAAVAFAEWLAITYGDRGIKVSCLCPQGVRTNMLGRAEGFLAIGALEPEVVAECVVEGLRDERFLILPHAEVAEYFRRRGDDHDRWLSGMRRMQARVAGPAEGT